ncbi:NlpC/P60 family protein [Halomonas sp. I1]|uniref:C40 family peptidase n=1 Tax=Halomonas sp. I1 TaxID=393536 RepID=UPI0028DE0B8A|nr:NlpC/P60 family protein [Halomonas sp. I1]MDT8895490.1 NlpC/P60 family protein [Halomonas sp. I1]
MIDVSEYIGLPFAPGGRGPRYDCWGIVRRVYADHLGIELPLHTGYADTLTDDTSRLMVAGRADWREVADPEPYDVVMFNVDGRPNHIGLVIGDGWMLHATRHKDACIERYRGIYSQDRIEGFYRYDHDCRPPEPGSL